MNIEMCKEYKITIQSEGTFVSPESTYNDYDYEDYNDTINIIERGYKLKQSLIKNLKESDYITIENNNICMTSVNELGEAISITYTIEEIKEQV